MQSPPCIDVVAVVVVNVTARGGWRWPMAYSGGISSRDSDRETCAGVPITKLT